MMLRKLTHTIGRIAVLGGLVLGLASTAMGEADKANDYFWEGANYDPSVPTVKSVLGYSSGEKITLHSDIVRYFEALQAAAPEQVRLFSYGETWEGRKLVYAAISSKKNIAALDQFKADMATLSDPRTTDDGKADAIIERLPASTWLAYGVHGNEISSPDAAMMTAYHLLAARGDARVPGILDNTIVFINPIQNPDGRDRFIHRFRTAKGLEADSDPSSAEHNEPWPSGRTNHYLFDMNRDWIVLTQPETQGHVRALQEWYPLVFVDLHEMGGDSSYYFAPEAVPYNPHLAKNQRDSLFLFGKNNAKWFDKFGFPYFTRDVFDAFYPGYGASWPAYYGAISMTYEQASSRGLVYHRYDGTDLPYAQTVRQHFITSLATAETTAANRKQLLSDFYAYQKSAIAEGRADRENRSYIFPAQKDPASAQKLASLLVEQGIEVSKATEEFKACGVTYGAGSFIIDAAQPRKRMIRTLLDPQVDMDADFVKEQERRRGKNFDHDIYDVTAWSMPIMFGVDMQTCGREVSVAKSNLASGRIAPATISGDSNPIAYIVDGGSTATVRLLSHALKAGLKVDMVSESFTLKDKTFKAGSLVIRVQGNPDTLTASLQKMAAETGAAITATNSAWVDNGTDLGSRYVNRVVAPKIAMLWDEPTSQYAAGNTRFVIERQFDYPVTVIRTGDLNRARLDRYQVLIIPSAFGSYKSALGERGAKELAAWVARGGVLIGTGTGVRHLADPDVNLLSIRRENQVKAEAGKAADKDSATVAGQLLTSLDDLKRVSEPETEDPDSVPGVFVRADLDPDHWLTAGLKSPVNVLVRGSDIYTPSQLDSGRNVAWFQEADSLLASGYLWEENRKQFAFKPFVVVEERGNGIVIGFTQDPTVRAYLDGLNVIFMNAIFHSAAQARPLR